ncbi:MAG: alkaline phosphatase family protein, partial [Kineosporiaceae bacterium]
MPTEFERAERAGLDVVRIGPGYFDGSGLTEAALRGGRFVAADTLQARVDATVQAVSGHRRLSGRGSGCLVYLYWGEVDKSGHVFGCGSWEWGEEVAQADAAVRQLAARLGPDTLLVTIADHGMVDIGRDDRVDVGTEPVLAAGVRHVGGEARALHLYCEPGAADDVRAAWTARLGSAVDVASRDQAVRAGWFGPVAPRNLRRIGDLVVVTRDPIAIVDSRTARPELLRLIGMHGAQTEEEQLIPMLVTTG